jgi:hypothetical protein
VDLPAFDQDGADSEGDVMMIPMPWDLDDVMRIEHSRLRRRMLYGEWRQDADAEIAREIGHVRKDAWGSADLSANPFRASSAELSTLYDEPPTITGDELEATALTMAVEGAGLWQLMQRAQRDCIGMREVLLLPTIGAKGLMIRVVPPDLVSAEASPDEPDVPTLLAELVMRDGRYGYDVYDIRGEEPVFYHADDQRRPIDGTRIAGEAYTWRYLDGTPYIPHTLYHATRTGQLFDAFEGIELVTGTLRLAVHYTYYGHVIKNAAWAQRWAANARPAGGGYDGEGVTARSSVVSDPATVLLLEPIEEGQPVQVGQFISPVDPQVVLEAILAYERRLMAMASLSPADAQRVAGDPRSGFALAINSERKTLDQRRFAPSFRRGDQELLNKIAAMLDIPGQFGVKYAYEVAAEAMDTPHVEQPSVEQPTPQENANG